MASMRDLELRGEKLAVVQRMYCFQHLEGDFATLIPVLSELARVEAETMRFDYYRFRAFDDQNLAGTDFNKVANSVAATVCHTTKLVRFGPFGNITMRPRGVGLGPALLANLIAWLQRAGLEDYAIEPGELSAADIKRPSDQVQRNRFYIAAGFSISNDAGQQGVDVAQGRFSAPSIGHLLANKRRLESLTPWTDIKHKLTVRA